MWFGWKCGVHLTLWLSRVISFQQPRRDRDKWGQHVTFWPADRKHSWHLQTWQTEERANSATNLKLYTPAISKECNFKLKVAAENCFLNPDSNTGGLHLCCSLPAGIGSDITVTSVLSEDGCSSPCEGYEIWKGTTATRWLTLMMQQEEVWVLF